MSHTTIKLLLLTLNILQAYSPAYHRLHNNSQTSWPGILGVILAMQATCTMLPAIGKMVTKQSAMDRLRKRMALLFLLILFLSRVWIARVLPTIDITTRPEMIVLFWFQYFWILAEPTCQHEYSAKKVIIIIFIIIGLGSGGGGCGVCEHIFTRYIHL